MIIPFEAMPYRIVHNKSTNNWEVRSPTGLRGKHKTKSEAMKQLAALNINASPSKEKKTLTKRKRTKR